MQKFSFNHIKSFEDSGEIEIKPITILVGKNSCGKSSLLRFPVVLAQTFREEAITPLLLFGNMIDYGNYDDVAYKHGDEPLGFQLSFGSELGRFVSSECRGRDFFREKIDYLRTVSSMKANLQVFIGKFSKKLEVDRMELCLDGENVCTIRRSDEKDYTFRLHSIYENNVWEKKEIEVQMQEIHLNRFIPMIDIEDLMNHICREEGIIKKSGKPLERYGFFASIRRYMEENIYKKGQEIFQSFYNTIFIIEAFLRSILIQLDVEASNLTYIGPFRENPKRIYRDSESSYSDVGVNGENTSMILRQASQGDKELLENVSRWLQSAMGYTLDIKEIGSGVYSLLVQGNEESDNIMDVGYGISQVLPIVTQLFNNERNAYRKNIWSSSMSVRKTMIFEQPEIHLHPAAQAKLADLFVDCIADKENNIGRILIETHSEHLIRKLQVLVADPEVGISSDQVAIYYVDKDETGNSHIEKMELCDNGQFEKEWPSGFFDKSYELTRLLMRANQKNLSKGGRND